MLRQFEGHTANDVWAKIALAFRDEEKTRKQSSRCGLTRELLHASLAIENPRERWVSIRMPPINVAFALAEVVWIISGRNDSKFINYFNRSLPKFAGGGSEYHGAYGHRLRCHWGVDQLERAYSILRSRPDSRQVVLQIWDGKVDLPASDGEEVGPDVPCNSMAMLKVREGRLEWMQILRSNDAFMGLPYNLVQFTTLQEVMSGWLGVEVGS